jgi:hypothetical protein
MDALLLVADLGIHPPVAGDRGDDLCRRALAREFEHATAPREAHATQRSRVRARLRWRHPLPLRPARGLGLAFAFALAVVAAAAVFASIAGTPTSIVARAYAATDPTAMIVHYLETSVSWVQGRKSSTSTLEVWTYGNRSHEILDPADRANRQDIVADGGHVYTLAYGELMTSLYSTAKQECSAADILAGCVIGQTSGPLQALRALYRSNAMGLSGQTTVDGHAVDVLVGHSSALQIRAFVDRQTFAPVRITLTGVSPRTGRTPSVTQVVTITGYSRQPVTSEQLHQLVLPKRPHARLARFFPCRELYPGCAAVKRTGTR